MTPWASVLIFFESLLLILPAIAIAAKTPEDLFVKTANYYLKAGPDINDNNFESLSRYDLLILPAEAQIANRNFLLEIKKKNPQIILLAYVPTMSWNFGWHDALHGSLRNSIKEEWWLKDSNGQNISIWPNTQALSIHSDWANFLPSFVKEEILATGLWDGVFFDEVDDRVSTRNSGLIDLDKNGAPDTPSEADALWRTGYIKMFARARELLGNDMLIIINGASNADYQKNINGRMFENFPTPWEGSGGWRDSMNGAKGLSKLVRLPQIFIFNATTENTGNRFDFQKMRFGLASALLANSFASFDYGDKDHGQLWWYDEYNVFLGKQTGEPRNILNQSASQTFVPSVWKRDFENGVVFINSTNQPQTINFDEDFEKIRGSQDPEINSGEVVTSVTLKSMDGIILLRPIASIKKTPYINGAFTKIFSGAGRVERNGFFSYNQKFRGGILVAQTDINNDGKDEFISADEVKIQIWNDDYTLKTTIFSFN